MSMSTRHLGNRRQQAHLFQRFDDRVEGPLRARLVRLGDLAGECRDRPDVPLALSDLVGPPCALREVDGSFERVPERGKLFPLILPAVRESVGRRGDPSPGLDERDDLLPDRGEARVEVRRERGDLGGSQGPRGRFFGERDLLRLAVIGEILLGTRCGSQQELCHEREPIAGTRTLVSVMNAFRSASRLTTGWASNADNARSSPRRLRSRNRSSVAR